jgi:hypothetical protein
MALLSRRDFVYLAFGGLLGSYGLKFVSSLLKDRNTRFPYMSPKIHAIRNKIKKTDINVIALRSKNLFLRDDLTYPYVDFINQDVVNTMIDEGITRLTQLENIQDAWKSLFNYRKGEKVLIKPNFNWINTNFEKIVTSPQIVNSVIRALIEYIGVDEKDIYLYDVSRPIPSFYRERISFNIRFVHRPISIFKRGWRKFFGDLTSPSEKEILTTFPVKTENRELLRCYLPKIVASGNHLINLPILKAHQFLLFSGAMKNHFGSVSFSNGSTSPKLFHGEHIHDFIADVNANKHLQKITRLVICDAIVGTWSDEGLGVPEKWAIFNNQYPSSLFFSRSPLTMDLYLSKLVRKERKKRSLSIKPYEFINKALNSGLFI